MAKNRVIGFTDFFGKVNAIVVKEDKVELQETEIRKFDCCRFSYFNVIRFMSFIFQEILSEPGIE